MSQYTLWTRFVIALTTETNEECKYYCKERPTVTIFISSRSALGKKVHNDEPNWQNQTELMFKIKTWPRRSRARRGRTFPMQCNSKCTASLSSESDAFRYPCCSFGMNCKVFRENQYVIGLRVWVYHFLPIFPTFVFLGIWHATSWDESRLFSTIIGISAGLIKLLDSEYFFFGGLGKNFRLTKRSEGRRTTS